MNKEQWLQERQKGIGGSDAAAIIGLNPYMTNVELWEFKTGRKKQADISGKNYVQYGIEAEKPLIDLFNLDYPEYDVYIGDDKNNILHPEYSFIRGSLDGILTEKSTGRKGILEIKTTNILQSMQREKWNDRIPDNYFIQILHYLLVTDYEFVILKAQLKSVWNDEIRLTTRHYHLERKDYKGDIEYLKRKEIDFWQKYVVADLQPPLILPEI